MKMNGIQFYNCLPKLVDCSQKEQYGVETFIAQNFGSLEMSNFDIYVWCI